MHELLEVEPGEVYEYEKGISTFAFYIDETGQVYGVDNSETDRLSAYYITKLINEPEGIIRKPRLTEEQIRHLKGLALLGFNYIAKDRSGLSYVYTNKPSKTVKVWISKTGLIHLLSSLNALDLCFLVSWDDPEPLNILETLKAAGVEISDA